MVGMLQRTPVPPALGGMAKTSPPQLTMLSCLAWSRNGPDLHERGQTPYLPKAGSTLQHRMCVAQSCSSEQARGFLMLGALSPLP